MDRLFCFDHFDHFELNMLAIQVLEQANAAAKQHRDEVNRDFINKAAFEELRRDVLATHDRDIFIPGRDLRPFERSFNAVSETVYTAIGYVFGNTVRNDDRWHPRRGGWPVCFPIRDGKIIGSWN